MMILFFYWKGAVHKELVPTGQQLNQVTYIEELERLRKRVVRLLRARENMDTLP